MSGGGALDFHVQIFGAKNMFSGLSWEITSGPQASWPLYRFDEIESIILVHQTISNDADDES